MLDRARPLAIDYGDTGGRALLGPPDKLEIIPFGPAEVRRGVLTFDDEGNIELLVRGHHVRYLDLDGILRKGGHGCRQQREYNG